MRALRIIAVATALLAAFLLGGVVTAPAAPPWAPAATATIHPGVETVTEGAQCTANFVFTEGSDVYIGQAAHCAGIDDGSTATSGCDSPSLPLGTTVEVEGASRPGVLAYSSWLTMQEIGETDPDACWYNDFALVRIDPADVGRVNPSMPGWGGPTALAPSTLPAASPVYTFGNPLLGLELLEAKSGIALADEGSGWSHQILTLTPGLPGSSGSGILDSAGRAIGVLSTLEVLPLVGSNNVGDLRLELDYMHSHSPIGANLAVGTEPFDSAALPLGS